MAHGGAILVQRRIQSVPIELYTDTDTNSKHGIRYFLLCG